MFFVFFFPVVTATLYMKLAKESLFSFFYFYFFNIFHPFYYVASRTLCRIYLCFQDLVFFFLLSTNLLTSSDVQILCCRITPQIIWLSCSFCVFRCIMQQITSIARSPGLWLVSLTSVEPKEISALCRNCSAATRRKLCAPMASFSSSTSAALLNLKVRPT